MNAAWADLAVDNERLRRELTEARKALADIRALCALDTPLLPSVVRDLIQTTRRSAE